MIHAMAWFSAEDCGFVAPGGGPWVRRSPNLAAAEESASLIGRPIRNFARMTAESRCCLYAASLALRATRWQERGAGEIGLLAAGYAGCLAADQQYFGDYVANGRLMGRGNLFIYTLPTSALGELAIGLKLLGPTLHIHSDGLPVSGLVRHARQLVADREADGVLALWSDLEAAVCLAVGPEACGGGHPAWPVTLDTSPLELAQRLAAMAKL